MQLKLGWQTWKQLGSSRFDVNLTFASEAARELKRLPGVGELNVRSSRTAPVIACPRVCTLCVWGRWLGQMPPCVHAVVLSASAAGLLREQVLTASPVPLQLVWDEAEGHSWLRYIRTYAAGVRHLYRRELPGTHDQQDFRVS